MGVSAEAPDAGQIVVCAVDRGPLTAHVLYHAAGFARALGARLKIVHVAERAGSLDATSALHRAYAEAIPYEAGGGEPDIAVRTGPVLERILEEANRPGVTLLVIGARGLGPLAAFVLGSTSQGVLRRAQVPVLLVPPSDIDIVFLSAGHGAIMCGPVVAAVDLAENNSRQLHMASVVASLAREPLMLMTVAADTTDDHAAGKHLRDRARGLVPARPKALIVRRGDVAEQIAHCARMEHAGLVVMGVRDAARGRPGVTAASVLRTGRTFVMAVPEACP